MGVFNQDFYQDNLYGSARWASYEEAKKAGLLRTKGLQLGFYNQKLPLHVGGDSPIITIGGSGSGKGRDLLIYNACNYKGSMLVHDCKAEIAAVSLYNQHRLGVRAYCLNPFGLLDLPQHGVNPLDILSPQSKTFHSDATVIAENFITLSGSSDGAHFEKGSRRWLEALMKFDCIVQKKEQTSLPQLHKLITMIEGNPPQFASVCKLMQQIGVADVSQVAGEIPYKQANAPKEFTGFMGTLYNAFGFMKEPAMVNFLQGGDVSLSAITDKQPTKFYLMIPAEFIEQYAPMIRLIFAVTMLYKQRTPQAKPVVYMVDEAGQLGNFPELLKCFTFGRGGGNRAWAVFQDVGQITRAYGREAITTFLGSAQTRQFFGVRDLETAQLVSKMLGTQTIEVDNQLKQLVAKRAKLLAVKTILDGGDPIYASYDANHHEQSFQHQEKKPRPLLTPDEILNLPEDNQILFVSGKNCPPILGFKYPYYSRRDMAGKYLPNPFHPPADKVKIAGRYFMVKVKHRKSAPFRCKNWPQFQKGFKWVKGYK